jgi:hypothetical protein
MITFMSGKKASVVMIQRDDGKEAILDNEMYESMPEELQRNVVKIDSADQLNDINAFITGDTNAMGQEIG